MNALSGWVLLVLLVVSGCADSSAPEATTNSAEIGEPVAFKVEPVLEGLGIPWGMVFLTAPELLFTERSGSVKLLNISTGKVTSIAGVPNVKAEGQGGLLDVALPPGYQSGDWIYFTYSKNQDSNDQNSPGVTTLARAKLQGNALIDWTELLVTRSATNATQHYGSRIAFDGQGHVYFTVGDRGDRANGQDLTNHAGSVLRLNLDGSIPSDNPFIQQQGALPEIWSYGHRNPQGLAWDEARQRLWAIEHGPRGGDEINLILKGRNYGWPLVSHGKEYWGPVAIGDGQYREGIEAPVKVYIPSIAPGSLLIYSGKAFKPWQGILMSGALVLTHLNLVRIDEQGRAVGETRLLESLGERIRALAESPEGWIYFSTDSGKIMRIVPVTGVELITGHQFISR